MNTKELTKIFHLSFSNSHLSLNRIITSWTLRTLRSSPFLCSFRPCPSERNRAARNVTLLKMTNENWEMINGKSVFVRPLVIRAVYQCQ